ncbi:hypothetical protein E1301_Tti003376 [Triplophysa tibetana]|uniref:Uncharacterized protein n=1 Tax=Triplophysa tibetana TaxID=1572043 RepID=A0A5A9PR54_9TELE|nr:hypothetical protein E1301_Tti003376 [Triplophysa tibetana]
MGAEPSGHDVMTLEHKALPNQEQIQGLLGILLHDNGGNWQSRSSGAGTHPHRNNNSGTSCSYNDDFDEYDKPGAERSRRRRGEDDDDLDSGRVDSLSLNATQDLGTSGHLNVVDPEGGGYTENAYNETEEGFFQDGAYEEEQYQGEDEGLEYSVEQNYEGYQDEVLDLQIDEPLDDDFQVDEYPTEYRKAQTDQQKMVEEEEFEEQTEVHDRSHVTEFEEVEHENDPEAEGEPEQDDDVKEESEEEEEDDGESGRLRFKIERKDATVSSQRKLKQTYRSLKRRSVRESRAVLEDEEEGGHEQMEGGEEWEVEVVSGEEWEEDEAEEATFIRLEWEWEIEGEGECMTRGPH